LCWRFDNPSPAIYRYSLSGAIAIGGMYGNVCFVVSKLYTTLEKKRENNDMDSDSVNKLISYCRLSQPQLKEMLMAELKALDREVVNEDGFLYSPGSHPVLLIAHLDTVHTQLPTEIHINHANNKGGDLWCSEGIGGDDRCGVYIIMAIIRQLDCYVLFCEDEESHGIGAEKFCNADIIPDIHFIVEFDRRNNDDAVFYNCDNKDFTDFVVSHGFNEEQGSFSDISLIAPHLGIAAVNISSGYYKAHSNEEYIRLDDVESIIKRAIPLLSNISKQYDYINRQR